MVKTKVEDWARVEAAGVGQTGGTEPDLNQCDLIFEAVCSTYCVYVTIGQLHLGVGSSVVRVLEIALNISLGCQ